MHAPESTESDGDVGAPARHPTQSPPAAHTSSDVGRSAGGPPSSSTRTTAPPTRSRPASVSSDLSHQRRQGCSTKPEASNPLLPQGACRTCRRPSTPPRPSPTRRWPAGPGLGRPSEVCPHVLPPKTCSGGGSGPVRPGGRRCGKRRAGSAASSSTCQLNPPSGPHRPQSPSRHPRGRRTRSSRGHRVGRGCPRPGSGHRSAPWSPSTKTRSPSAFSIFPVSPGWSGHVWSTGWNGVSSTTTTKRSSPERLDSLHRAVTGGGARGECHESLVCRAFATAFPVGHGTTLGAVAGTSWPEVLAKGSPGRTDCRRRRTGSVTPRPGLVTQQRWRQRDDHPIPGRERRAPDRP